MFTMDIPSCSTLYYKVVYKMNFTAGAGFVFFIIFTYRMVEVFDSLLIEIYVYFNSVTLCPCTGT